MRKIILIPVLLIGLYLAAFYVEPGCTDTIDIVYESTEPVYILGAKIIEVPENIDCIINFTPELVNEEVYLNKYIRKQIFESHREFIDAKLDIDTTVLEKRITKTRVKFIVDRSSDIQKKGGIIKIAWTDGFNNLKIVEFEINDSDEINGLIQEHITMPVNEKFYCELEGNNQWVINAPVNQNKYSIKIFNINGRLVRTICENQTNSSIFLWNGKDEYNNAVQNGIYFVRLSEGKEYITDKIWIIK